MSDIVYLFLWTLVLIPFFLMYLPVLAAIWVRFGALTCFLVARSRGLAPLLYARWGAACSLLLILPWLYLLTRMCGRSVPQLLVVLSNIAVFGIWFMSVVGNVIIWSGFQDHGSWFGPFWTLLSLPAMFASLFAMGLLAPGKYEQQFPNQSDSLRKTIPHPLFMLPFAGALIGTCPLLFYII